MTQGSPHNIGDGNTEKSVEGDAKSETTDVHGNVSDGADELQVRVQTLLAGVTSKAQLDTLLEELPYTVDALKMLRESLPTELQGNRILDFAAGILIETWSTDVRKAGTMATLLSQTWQSWHPESSTITELIRLCDEAIEKGDTSMIAVVQPTAYVLGALGHGDFYSKWLHTTTTGERWREADLKRNTGSYYAAGSETSRRNQLAAIDRHLRDTNRQGLLRAHDIGLLVEISREHRTEGLDNDHPEVQQAQSLLSEVIVVLKEHQQEELLTYIRAYLGR